MTAWPGSNPRRHLLSGLSLLLYVVLACWSTWPLSRFASSSLALGTSQNPVVPLFNVWTIWWNADRLSHGFQDYWQAPIFHPVHDTFAFSEPQPVTILLAPLLWLTGSRVLAYNVYLLGNLVLNGGVTEWILRRQGVARWLSVAGGAAMVLLPIVHWQREVLQLIPLGGILWTWSEFCQSLRNPSLRGGLRLGLAFALTFFICVHQALLLAILLGPLALIGVVLRLYPGRRPSRNVFRLLGQLTVCWGVALAVAGVVTAPVLGKLREVSREAAFHRDAELVEKLSAWPGDYTSAWGEELIKWRPPGVREGWRLSAGWLKSGLAVSGILLMLRYRRKKLETALLGILLLLAGVLSLGNHVQVMEVSPWDLVRDFIPGARGIRSLFRFAYFVQLGTVLLAIGGLHILGLLMKRARCSIPVKAAGSLMLSLLALACVFEAVPSRVMLAGVPDAAQHRRWLEFVHEHIRAGEAILTLPVATGDLLQDYQVTTRSMYLGTYHGIPLVDGYSGFFPAEHFPLRDDINRQFPTPELLQQLWELKVRLVVVDHEADISRRFQHLESQPSSGWSLVPVFKDPQARVTIYKLTRE